MKWLKKLWRGIVRSKTNLFAALLAGASTLQMSVPSFSENLTPGEVTAIGVALAMVIVGLRGLTTEPLKDKVER